MVMQEIMIGFLNKSQAFSSAAKYNIGIEKASPSVVKTSNEREAFKNQLKEVQDRRNANRIELNKSISKDNGMVNSYRESMRSRHNTQIKHTERLSKTTDDCYEKDNTNKEENDVKKLKGNQITQEELVIAQVLGIQPEAFREIMDKLGIDTQNIQSEDKISAIVDNISQKLGLDSDSINTLKNIIKDVLELIDTKAVNGSYGQYEIHGSDEYMSYIQEAKGMKIPEESSQNMYQNSLDGLVVKLKEKIMELTKEAQENPEEMKIKLAEIVEAMMDKNGRKLIQDEGLKNSTISSNEEETSKIQQVERRKENEFYDSEGEESYGSETKESQSSSTEEKILGDGKGTNTQESFYIKSSKDELGLDAENRIKDSDLSVAGIKEQSELNKAVKAEAFKVLKEQPVSKREILTQVIDKAKVVLNGDKSEMVLSMRPESLGKLSLKIVTENGIITAKFIAESQQVKEVLESNMQLLKDTLEKQGYVIQGLSVSVDSNKSREFHGHRDYDKEQKAGNGKVGGMGHNSVTSMEARSNIEKVNPYLMGESRINLTA
ncbi:MAG TPA: flagellar hook-length control protein FliK [Pseudobacteroides sp.]|nr:flagellar hook-length control protein FliK [Pseudobacteroides sp.]